MGVGLRAQTKTVCYGRGGGLKLKLCQIVNILFFFFYHLIFLFFYFIIVLFYFIFFYFSFKFYLPFYFFFHFILFYQNSQPDCQMRKNAKKQPSIQCKACGKINI